jgi:hypothetical protein
MKREKKSRSRIAPYLEGETSTERHQRRLDTAMGMVPEALRGLAELGLDLLVSPDGQCWRARDNDGDLVVWFPFSGRCKIVGREASTKIYDVVSFTRAARLATNMHGRKSRPAASAPPPMRPEPIPLPEETPQPRLPRAILLELAAETSA